MIYQNTKIRYLVQYYAQLHTIFDCATKKMEQNMLLYLLLPVQHFQNASRRTGYSKKRTQKILGSILYITKCTFTWHNDDMRRDRHFILTCFLGHRTFKRINPL